MKINSLHREKTKEHKTKPADQEQPRMRFFVVVSELKSDKGKDKRKENDCKDKPDHLDG